MSDNITHETFEAFRRGEIEAYDAIFLAYSKRVRIYIDKIIDSTEDAKELTQDVFIKLWNNREKVDLRQNVTSYIFVVAKNLALNFLRDRKTQNSYISDFYKLNDEFSTMEDDITGRYTQLLIKMTVATLPKRQRRIFLMSHEQGLTNEQIAEELNISKKSVENSLSLTRSVFRKLVYLMMIFG